jgi:hypothetical protein
MKGVEDDQRERFGEGGRDGALGAAEKELIGSLAGRLNSGGMLKT